MTNWTPTLRKSGKPLYIELADAIERDIETGTLTVGEKLPPHRNIAFDIGVTVGTISRGYALACERGLVVGEIGRGTFVTDPDGEPKSDLVAEPIQDRIGMAVQKDADVIDLSSTATVDIGQGPIISEVSRSIATKIPEIMIDYVRAAPGHWREAGQQWLSRSDWTPEIGSIVTTNGAYPAITAIIGATTSPGEKIVFESLCYTPAVRGARLLGRRVLVTETDADGIVPEGFEKLCAQQHPKLLYLMPSAQNPTATRLSEKRREEIAEIAKRHNILIIEDCVYGAVVVDPFKPISHFAPDHTFYIGGLSKSLSASIRVGWVTCPLHFASRVANAHKLLAGPTSLWMAELGATLVLEDHAKNLRDIARREVLRRINLVREKLAKYEFNAIDDCPYIWLKLPDPWNSGSFQNALAKRKVIVTDEDVFKPLRTEQVHHAVRISFSAPQTNAELLLALETITDLLENGVAAYDDTN